MKYQPIEAGHIYHVFNKGNNKENIFKESKNYTYFLTLAKKYFSENMIIYAYCLMPNHFHFVLKVQESCTHPSRLFSNLFNAYSKAINKMYKREGSLFKDRFSRKKVEDENYLRNLIVYVHTNPMHHGFDKPFNQYEHSSYGRYFEKESPFINFENIRNLFSDLDNFEYCHQEYKIKNTFILEE